MFNEDAKLGADLRKAPKLSFESLHPGHNKQKVNLALAIFHESIIAGCKAYLPDRTDMAAFPSLINTWWTIVNSNQRYHPNPTGNAIVANDGKIKFLSEFAEWLENWSFLTGSRAFCLSRQTSNALIMTLRSQTALSRELLEGEYTYVLTRRFESDPIERRFSQYRQMNGRNFLVSLKEVSNSEKILMCKSLIKYNLNFWDTELKLQQTRYGEDFRDFKATVSESSASIQEATLSPESEEVAFVVASFVAKRLIDKNDCQVCKSSIAGDTEERPRHYFNLLSRGGLTVPSSGLTEHVVNSFAVLDAVEDLIQNYPSILCRLAAEEILQNFFNIPFIGCDEHSDWAIKLCRRTLINIFFNN